jgi:hypothetical protein
MKYKILILLCLTCIIVSCEKVTNIKIIDSPSTGKLNYKIVDDSGIGLSAVKVSVYENRVNSSGIYFDPAALIDTVRTDKNGVAAFSNLVPANYLIVTDSPTVNKVKYNTREFIQMVAGVEKNRTTKASEFSGFINVTMRSNLDYSTPLKNMGVAAVPYNPNHLTSDNIRSILNAAVITGITDDNGYVTIKIPSNIDYTLVAYSLDKGAIGWGYGINMVEKDMIAANVLYMSPVNQ